MGWSLSLPPRRSEPKRAVLGEIVVQSRSVEVVGFLLGLCLWIGWLFAIDPAPALIEIRLSLGHAGRMNGHGQCNNHVNLERALVLADAPASRCLNRNSAADRQPHVGVGIQNQ